MNIYLTEEDAISDLHKKGYSNDFHLFGNDLLWVQRQIFIRTANFSIVECHRFFSQEQEGKEIIVFAIIVQKYNAKGVLLNDYSNYTTSTPPVIVKKLEEMNAYTG
jgi:hypothetical protein